MEKIAMIVFANYWVLLSPCLSYMLYDFFQEGMIFEKYGKWLTKEESWNNRLTERIKSLNEELINCKLTLTDYGVKCINEELAELEKSIVKIPFYKKPLGGCLKCFHVWIFIIVGLLSGIFFIKYILLLALSYVILIKLFF